MLLRQRNLNLTHTQAIRRDKESLVLEWLLEFRFSSLTLLSLLLGQSVMNSNRFFNRLIDSGLIRPFTNVHTRGYRYVMLTGDGVSYLEAEGCDIVHACTRVKNLGRYSTIIHDLAVQETVIEQMSNFESVSWDRHLPDGEVGSAKPDALLSDAQGHRIALEVERWRKDEKRICMVLEAHAKAIHAGLYHGVLYRFEKEADMAHYRALLDRPSWSRFIRVGKSGKIVATGDLFSLSELDPDEDLREAFVFSCKPFLEGVY